MPHKFSRSRRILLACLLLAAPLTAPAQDPELHFTQVSTRSAIVDIAKAGDGSGRLFLVQQFGRIYINQDGVDLDTPFLSIQNKITTMGDEQGLLSVAFPPDYETSGYFYVWYTNTGGGTVLSRFRVSDGDPNVADPDSEQVVLSVVQPFDNHNGGRLQFGPDGMLYLGLGDGGGAFDPDNNAQDGSTLLGKLIRIDVDPAHGTYAIPPDNPFVGNGAVRDEIWALGLHNPWRISFDAGNGDLYIADVGQNVLEEINHQPAGSGGGENYGWDTMEGSQCTGGGNACNAAGLTLPVAEYEHSLGCSVSGGEVYRGNDYPNMFGMYFFGDYCTGNIWGLRRNGNQWDMTLLEDTSFSIPTFGRGEDGNVYVASQSTGVYLISDGEPVSDDFVINTHLSDAWFYPVTDGQGFFIIVWPDNGVFLSWFTYDTERPPQDAEAILGEPGHRWLTAQGPFSGNTANLQVYLTAGGVFDSDSPPADDPSPYGTITITWSDCENALLTYDLTTLGLAGQIPLQRIVNDNVAACEAHSQP